MLLLGWLTLPGHGDQWLEPSYVAMTVSTLIATVLFELMLAECWRLVRQEQSGLPSTFEMLALQFVPIVHFYWWFAILGRLSAGLNGALERRQLPAVRALVWLAPVTGRVARGDIRTAARDHRTPVGVISVSISGGEGALDAFGIEWQLLLGLTRIAMRWAGHGLVVAGRPFAF